MPAGPFAALAGLDPGDDHRPVLRTLLRRLAVDWSVRYAALWLPDDSPWRRSPGGQPALEPAGQRGRGPWTPSVVWRSAEVVLPAFAADPERLVTFSDVVATAEVAGGGILVLAGPAGARPGRGAVARLGETAVCAGLLLRLARHSARRDVARERAEEADRRLRDIRLELSTVQAVERDRLAAAVTARPSRQLAAILAYVEALERMVDHGCADRALVMRIRSGLNDMIEQFRTVVRGVYPQVLRGSGVRAALGEIASTLPVPVVFHGEFGRRQRWEIESGLFQAGASAITALSGSRAGAGHPSAPGRDGGARAPEPEPIHVELYRAGDVLSIRVRRVGAEPSAVQAALRDDARRLAALGGELRVVRVPEPGAPVTGVVIRLPERLGGESPVHVPGDEPVGAARHLLGLLVARQEGPATPVRVATGRQDGLARVALVGEQAGRLIRTWCGPDWEPPDEARGVSVCYQHHAYRRILLEPAADRPPWLPVRLRAWDSVDWSDPASGLNRILVELPARALRGMRLVHHRDRVDADLAARLRGWDGTAEGPPDVVVCVLDRLVGTAEVEFLNVLRSPAGVGFSPLTVLAVRDGAELGTRMRKWLGTAGDVVAGWHPGDLGGTEVGEALRTWLRGWAGLLGERWAQRALAGAGELDAAFAAAVEANAASAYRLAELELAQQLRGGRIRLPRGHDDALRLLGAEGADVRTRLGLDADATPDQVADAADRALGFWRIQAMSAEPVPGGRGAYGLLVEACERLVAHAGH